MGLGLGGRGNVCSRKAFPSLLGVSWQGEYVVSNASGQDEPGMPRISGLEMQEKIGEGGWAWCTGPSISTCTRSVAVKVLRDPAGNAAAPPAWQRESRLMASLAHPNVVTIHDAGQIDGHNYLVLEYMAGGSLRSRMQPGRPWRLADAIPVLDCVAQALCHIHAQGVLHLDLTPENVLYTPDGQIKITDFGLAVPNAETRGLLEGQGPPGTIDYAAPEQRFGLALDARCDVFSLATLGYELLTGRLPGRVYVPLSRQRRDCPRRSTRSSAAAWREIPMSVMSRWTSSGRPCSTPAVPAGRAFAAGCSARRPFWRRWSLSCSWRMHGEPPLGSLPGTAAAPGELPTRLWMLYDKPEDLSLFAGEAGGELSNSCGSGGAAVVVEQPKR